MKKQTKKTIWLIILILVYIPVIFFDLFTIVVSHISYPCGFIDFQCLINHHSYDSIIINIKGLLIIIMLNLLFIVPIIKMIINISKEEEEEEEEEQQNNGE